MENGELEYYLTWSRYILYFYTMALISLGCFFFGTYTLYSGLMYVVMLVLGIVCVLLLYVYLPFKVQSECLSPLLVKGRPFLGLYHLGLLLSVPLFVLFFLSFGRLNSLREYIVSDSISMVQTRRPAVNSVFKVADGFVAVNSTISIVTTLSKHALPVYDSLYYQYPTETDESYVRIVPEVFYSEAKVLQAPFDEFKLTQVFNTHIDARDQLTVAPIFQSVKGCLSHFPPIHINCARENIVIGFALWRDRGLCRSYVGATVCKEYVHGNVQVTKETPLTLNPTYNCTNNAGLCARITNEPSDQLKQQIVNRMTANGWTIDPETSLLWIEVNELTECELNPDYCRQNYTKIAYVAVALLALALASIFAAFVLDFHADLLVARLANDYKYRQVAKINTLYTS